MKVELDEKGFRVTVVWASLRAALKTLLPLITAVTALVAAPEVQRLGALLELW